MSDELSDLKFQVELLNNKVYGELDAAVRDIDTKITYQQNTINAYTSEYTSVRDIVRNEIYTFLNSLTFDDLCKILFDKAAINLNKQELEDINTLLRLNGCNYTKVIHHVLKKVVR